jgi:hypothetical protein
MKPALCWTALQTHYVDIDASRVYVFAVMQMSLLHGVAQDVISDAKMTLKYGGLPHVTHAAWLKLIPTANAVLHEFCKLFLRPGFNFD